MKRTCQALMLVVRALYAQIQECFCVVEWINDLDIFRIKNAVNQALQCTRKKPLINWLIRNRWRLRRQTNSNLDWNQGLRISRTNDRMNDHVDERTNELSEFSAGIKRLMTMFENWTNMSSYHRTYILNTPAGTQCCTVVAAWFNPMRTNSLTVCHI